MLFVTRDSSPTSPIGCSPISSNTLAYFALTLDALQRTLHVCSIPLPT